MSTYLTGNHAKQREIDIVLTLKEFILVSECVHVCICARRQKHRSQTQLARICQMSQEKFQKRRLCAEYI